MCDVVALGNEFLHWLYSYVLSAPCPAVLKVGLPILEAELKDLNIPDISGDAHSPIGHIEYSLSK